MNLYGICQYRLAELLCCWSLGSRLLAFLTTWTTIATVTTLTAVTTLATLWTWTTLALYITLGLLEKHAARELELAGLRIDVNKLNLKLVTLLDASLLDSLKTLPVDLRDVEQTVLSRHELYEATVRHDAANGTVVNLAYLWDGNDSLDLSHCSVDNVLARTAYLNLAYAVFLVDGDGSTSLFLYTLDDLTARTDDSTYELLRNDDLLDAWYMRLEFWTWSVESLHHLSKDVLATSLCLHESLLENLV